MFAVEERDRTRKRLLDLAADDPAVVGAAIIGSHAADGGDRWSDIDIAFGIDGQLSAVLDRWTRQLYDEFGALHHWDLRSGATLYRVFLPPDWLEVDIATASPGRCRGRADSGARADRPGISDPATADVREARHGQAVN